jgi:hypothetical protein
MNSTPLLFSFPDWRTLLLARAGHSGKIGVGACTMGRDARLFGSLCGSATLRENLETSDGNLAPTYVKSGCPARLPDDLPK